jgi:UDP-N-acetylglucosamine--N-acetylmuramyl-(pentapeptide) pyrophosphoryl-undecaprenol N-acetylglucosamine transferase
MAISTGASLAVNFLPKAARLGVPTYYIESAARATGPSLTGRILERLPGVNTYCQYPAWAGGRWVYAGSVFDGFVADAADAPPSAPVIRKAVVSVGTTESYGFRRLVERAALALEGVPDVTWQTGPTDLGGLGIDGRESIPSDELNAAIASADVVVTHAGTGIALTCLELGKVPVLVPRSRRHGEHIDDHQQQIADELQRRRLAVVTRPEDLDGNVLHFAARQRVRALTTPPPLLFA